MASIAVDYFEWIETENSLSRLEARHSTSDVDEVYYLTAFLPGLRGGSYPAPELWTGLIGANSEIEREERTI